MTYVTINIDQGIMLYDDYAYFFASNTIHKRIIISEQAGNNAKKAIKLIERATNIREIYLKYSIDL